MGDLDEWLTTERGQTTLDLVTLWARLSVDVAQSAALLESHADNQFARRTYVRAVVAKVEGFTAKLKGLTESEESDEDLTPAERMLLTEVSPVLDDHGRAQTVNLYPRLEPNLRFAMTIFARVNGVTWSLPVDEDGWGSLVRTVKVRNRIMHPKVGDDLNVTDREVSDAKTGIAWLDVQYGKMQDLIVDKIAYDAGLSVEQIRRFREMRRRLPENLVDRGPAA